MAAEYIEDENINILDEEAIMGSQSESDVSDAEDEDYVPDEDASTPGSSSSLTESETDTEESSDESSKQESDAHSDRMSRKGIFWRETPPKKTKTQSHNILRCRSGPLSKFTTISPKDAWDLFITDNIIEEILKCTNREGRRIAATKGKEWKTLKKDEFLAFIGLVLFAGCEKNWDVSVRHMFGDLLHNPLYKATMAVGRFEDILHVLCFDDKKSRASRREKDKMAPFRCIWELFLVNCRKRFSPNDCVTVDEQLVPFKGRCRFLQYMPRKPAKYGIKIFWLCDARVPYAIDGIVYTGREPGKEIRKNVGENVVRQLCSGIRNTGRSITTDNFFTSVGLAESLKELGLGLVGTLRQNKVEIPPVMKPSESRKVYSSEFGFNGSMTMVSYVPKRKKAVVLLSTVHHDKVVDEDSQKKKPEIIIFYNQTKGGVDVMDQMVRTYTCKRKTRRWTMVLWYNVLDVATLNAYTFFTSQHPECYRGVPSARRHFLKELTLQLITPYMKIRLENTRGLPKQTIEAMERCGVTKSESLPMGENEENQLKKRKRCHMCPSSKDRKTQTYCMKCYVPVCRDHRQKKVVCVKCIEGKTK